MKMLQIVCATILTLFLFDSLHAQQEDLTRVPEAAGTNVVLATISIIQQTSIFPDDNRLLRRIAHVESGDGLDGDTYREGYNGGIWQVDEEIFLMTLDITSFPFLLEEGGIYPGLLSQLGIDWSAARWEDLRIPLISGVAARIFFAIAEQEGSNIPDVGDVMAQGEFWKSTGFNSNDEDTVQVFVQSVTALELEECPNRGIDLAFVLDSSGSVGEDNFALERQLVSDIVNRFDIGPTATQVAVISYSGFAVVNFHLNNFTNRTDVQEAISQVEYFDIEVVIGPRRTSTNTADALIRLRKEVFGPEGGARAADIAIPRIAVVITDGRSNINQSLTIPSALALRDEGITVYSVGIGSNIDMEELMAIASSPDNVMLIRDFDVTEFDGLRSRITADACTATVPIALAQIISIELEMGEVSFFEYQVPEEGITLTLRRQQGSATLYASNKLQNPNSALYDYRIDGEGQVYVDPEELLSVAVSNRRKRESVTLLGNVTTLYVSVEGIEDVINSFEIEASLGNTVSSGYRCCTSFRFTILLFLITLLLNIV